MRQRTVLCTIAYLALGLCTSLAAFGCLDSGEPEGTGRYLGDEDYTGPMDSGGPDSGDAEGDGETDDDADVEPGTDSGSGDARDANTDG